MLARVKVCGLTNLADARAAAQAGADLLGFIFYPASPRYVSPEAVRLILAGLRAEGLAVVGVGVFVNETPARVAKLLDWCGLQLAQLHGEEPPTDLGLADEVAVPLRGRAFKALRPQSLRQAYDLTACYALPAQLRADGQLPAFLLDTYRADRRGGTGQTGDWALAAELAGRYPLLLAGGLSPDNVVEALQRVCPWGVDVSSGVERAPGQKDHGAVRAFIEAVREAAMSRPAEDHPGQAPAGRGAIGG